MKRALCTLIISTIACFAIGQSKQEFVIIANDTEGRRLMLSHMGNDAVATEMTVKGNQYSANLPASESGFYNLVSVKGQSQTIIPFYVPITEVKTKAKVTFGAQGAVSIDGSEDNKALADYVTAYAKLSRSLWAKGTNLKNSAVLEAFIGKGDSILNIYNCSPDVKKYLKIWGYINAYDNYSSVQHILRLKTSEMPYQRKDILDEPHTVLDTPLAALFANTPRIVYSSLPNQNNLDSALIFLETHYSDTILKKKVKNDIAARYVSRYNYNVDFDKGYERLKEATERYSLNPRHLEEFAKHRSSVPGQSFPSNVVLKDINGNIVDFATFRGKYVYIDLWASWCVPCLREVPVLQQLEKELKNDKVVFLSISIDTREDAWKSKMKEKNMHGNQLWDPTNSLGLALNVKGIPFFAIYDPEGKLYMHGAPRPSQGPGLVRLLEDLK